MWDLVFMLSPAVVAAVLASLLAAGTAVGAQPVPCPGGISRDTAERLFAILNHPLADTECRFEGVGTTGANLEARWSRSGTPLPAISVVPRECAPLAAEHAGAFAIAVPREIGDSCPSVRPLIEELVRELAGERAVAVVGSEHDPLFRSARELFIGIFFVAGGLLLRGTTRVRSLPTRWVIIAMASFIAALVVRAALPFSLGNWYSEVMPATGPPPWMRFGPGPFAFQSLLRDAGIWGPRTLILSQIVIGAMALPLMVAVLWELRVGFAATAATLVLLVFAPFHARLSATASEHVLASTLCLALLLCWLRAVHRRAWAWFGLTALLFPAVCATRVDMIAQASVVLLWPLLADRAERESGGRTWPSRAMIAALAVVVPATWIAAYQLIVLPSRHPTPDWTGHLFALRFLVPQFWLMATNDPAWISLSSVLLAVPGAVALAVRRPLLFVRVAGTVLVAFVALGRTFMHDELLGARYFLFVIPIFLIASGYGFESVLAVVPQRWRGVAVAAAMAGLALWTGLAARSAYAARYAFEDEYAFARGALAQLPAGCTVYQVRIRADALPHDVDCCLDIPRSPLVLEFPTLRLFDLPDNPAPILTDAPCVAFYEGVACEIAPGPPDRPGHDFAEKAAAYFQPRCSEARRLGRLELLAETTTSPRTTEGFFAARRPYARLYRWLP